MLGGACASIGKETVSFLGLIIYECGEVVLNFRDFLL